MRRATSELRRRSPLGSAAALAVCLLASLAGAIEGPPLRFRLAYASQEPVRWDATVSADDGEILAIQPLSIDPRHTGAVYGERGELRIDYHAPASRGVIDFDISGANASQIIVRAGDGQSARFSIDQVRNHRQPQTVGDTTFQLERAPSDRVRIVWPKATRIFKPNEQVSFDAWIDPLPDRGDGPLELTTTLNRGRGGEEVWRSETTRFEPIAGERAEVGVAVRLPASEGVYEVVLAVREPPGFSRRFFPQGEGPPLLERRFQVLVLDESQTPRTALSSIDAWRVVHEPELGEQRSRARLAAWARWRSDDSLTDLPDPTTAAPDGWRRLPPATAVGAATWRALPLAVPDRQLPVLIEIETRAQPAQKLAVALLDTDGRGKLTPVGDAVVISPAIWPQGEQRTTRFLRWARTGSPLLVIANLDDQTPADFRGVRVYQPNEGPASPAPTTKRPQRHVALDLRSDSLLSDLAVSDAVDEKTGVRFADLESLWQAAQRAADAVEAQAATGAVVRMSSPGAAWYESRVLGDAPTHDLGMWVEGAVDLPRRPLPELLLREFSRRGLTLVPALRLSGPLPDLERRARVEPETILVAADAEWAPGKPRYNPLTPAVAATAEDAIAELAERFGRYAAFGGVAVTLDEATPVLLTGDALTGFDTPTVERFLADMGVEPPPGDISRQRYRELITEQAGEHWQAWRRQQLAEMHRRMDAAAPGPVIRLIDPLLEAVAVRSRYATPLNTPASTGEGIDSLGLAVIGNGTSVIPAVAAPDAQLIAWREAAAALTGARTNTPQHGLLVAPRRRFLLSGSAESLGAEVTLNGVVVTPDAAAAPIGSYLTADGPTFVVDQGAASVGVFEPTTIALRRLVSRLPIGARADADTSAAPLSEDSVVVTPIRTDDGTLIVATNTGPWPQQASVSIETAERCTIEEFLADNASGIPERCRPGAHVLAADLPPFAAHAWRVTDQELSLTGLRVRTSPQAAEALTAAVERLTTRDRSARRAFDGLPNASFEAAIDTGAIADWSTAETNSLLPSTDEPAAGERCLGLSPRQDVAVSDWFRAPATGQFALVMQARGVELADDAKLRIDFELDDGGLTTRTLQGADLLAQWREVVFAVDDLPLDRPRMRLRFTLVGSGGEVFLDALQAEDLMLPLDYYAEETRGQRFALVRLGHQAEAALAEGRFDDCRRLLEGYWPQFVMQNFPAVTPAAESLAAPDSQPADSDAEPQDEEAATPSFAERVRQYLPRWWR